MFYVVETEEQLKLIEAYKHLPSFVEVITTHDYIHPALCEVVGLYIRPLVNTQGYFIPISHYDTINIDIDKVKSILSSFLALYTRDKKRLMYYIKASNLIDIQLMYSLNMFELPDLSVDTKFKQWFYGQHPSLDDPNRYIPIPKLHGECEELFYICADIIEEHKDILKDECWDFYNKEAVAVFYWLEKTPIGIHPEKFQEVYKVKNPKYSIKGGLIYGHYNLYNNTSRPTNSFNNINFLAIPKDETHRTLFKPLNDKFIEIDFDGYHIRLLADQVGHGFSDESVHTQLARKYFNKQDINEEDYQKSKANTFHIIYGGIPDKWKHILFIKQIDELTQRWWESFENEGLLRSPKSKKPFTHRLKEMNPQKLMNYVIQNLEFTNNTKILKELFRYLVDKKTKVVLNIYDSFILDFSEEDGSDTLKDIIKIISQNNKFPVKYKESNSLYF